MKLFDMHIHGNADTPDPKALLAKMQEAGIAGGCIFSAPPMEQDFSCEGLPSRTFDARLEEILGWSRGHEDRLFPILWISPREENIYEKIEIAVSRGVAGFKMICTDWYVYDEICMNVLRRIAQLGKPVIFHTGILFDGHVSSCYNRPLNWEALLEIPDLCFSMGHCSWPWIDECIALYGKFEDANNRGVGAQMYLDLTPGTPPIYRRELLTKLYKIGFKTEDRVLFGTDSYASKYKAKYPAKLFADDMAILDELEVGVEAREKLAYRNLMRFLGVESQTEF